MITVDGLGRWRAANTTFPSVFEWLLLGNRRWRSNNLSSSIIAMGMCLQEIAIPHLVLYHHWRGLFAHCPRGLHWCIVSSLKENLTQISLHRKKLCSYSHFKLAGSQNCKPKSVSISLKILITLSSRFWPRKITFTSSSKFVEFLEKFVAHSGYWVRNYTEWPQAVRLLLNSQTDELCIDK